MTTQLKSLAHPEWPYVGTSFEWRGFFNRLTLEQQWAALGNDPALLQKEMPKVQPIYQKQNFGPELP